MCTFNETITYQTLNNNFLLQNKKNIIAIKLFKICFIIMLLK